MTLAHPTVARARRFAPSQPAGRRGTEAAEDDPTVTVTVRVTLHGDDAPAAAAQFVSALRSVTDGAIADSTITISSPERAAAHRRWPELDLRPTVAATPAEPAGDSAGTGAATGEADLVIFADQRIVRLGDRPVPLSRREYDLLLFLAENPRRVFTRAQLLQAVWEYDFPSGGRTVDVHVRRLRVKLEGGGPTIATVRGVGYRLDEAQRVRVIQA